MAYKDPTRFREIVAQEIYGKSFDELTDEEKQAVHNEVMGKKTQTLKTMT